MGNERWNVPHRRCDSFLIDNRSTSVNGYREGFSREALNKSTSEMKWLGSFPTNQRTSHIPVGRKAHGAQYRAKRQTAVGWPRRGEKPQASSQPEHMGYM